MILVKSYWKSKDLFVQLTLREIKSKYKQSILGYAWVILVPLFNLLVLTVVFSFFVRIRTGAIPYTIFLFVGLVPWTFTSNAISAATSSVVSNSTLITKVFFPREIIPLSAIAAKLLDFFLISLILILFIVFYRIPFHLSLLFVPLIFIIQLCLVCGISLILSSVNIFFRDVENILGVFLMFWMYLTPVLYPPQLVPVKYLTIYNLNPMTPLINAYRNVILYGIGPNWSSFLYSVICSIIALTLGYIIFRKLEKSFADVI